VEGEERDVVNMQKAERQVWKNGLMVAIIGLVLLVVGIVWSHSLGSDGDVLVMSGVVVGSGWLEVALAVKTLGWILVGVGWLAGLLSGLAAIER
jgi:hypothetical protein